MRVNGRVFLRGTIYWIAYYLHGIEYRESAKTDDRKKAERFLRHRLKEVGADSIGAKTFVTPQMQRATVNELLDSLTIKLKLDGRLSRGTISLIKIVRAAFGEMRATAVTADHVSKYIENCLAEGYKPASVNRRTETLHRAFTLAVEHKRLTEVPSMTALSEKGNVRRGFTQRQTLDQVIANLPVYLRDVVLFAFLSSWRKGEILSLTWDNVTPDAIRLSAEHSKEREARSLALEGELAELVARRQAAAILQGASGESRFSKFVFHRGGKPVGEFRKSWATACKLAGVPGLLFHDLRRSGVRDMIRAGVSSHTAMSISGHKTDSMLRRYAIISESDQRAAIRRTEDFRQAEQKVPEISRRIK